MSRGRAALDGLPPGYGISVYINCPFDKDYRQYFEAIIFTVVACGLEPKSAAIINVADTRIERIASLLADCRFSIHDLSLLGVDSRTKVARMNMPLELGIAMALHRMSKRQRRMPQHDWTALVRQDSSYKEAISDSNGNDLQRYGDRNELVSQVMNWFSDQPDGTPIEFAPSDVVTVLATYDKELETLRPRWYDKLPWNQIVTAAKEIARREQLLPPLA